MNKIISALAVTLCLTSSMALAVNRESRIDWTRDNNDDECLCNKINLQGPKIVLVNLDDHCQLDEIEDQGGLFILSGDLIVITGRNNASASQSWDVSGFDAGVVGTGNNFDLSVDGSTGTSILQDFIIFTGEGSGATTATFNFIWGGIAVRTIDLDIYVDEEPALAYAAPRSCDRYEYTNMGK